MSMTLLRYCRSGRAHEHTRGRVQPVLGGQSVVAVVGDYVVCGCIYEVFRASACPEAASEPTSKPGRPRGIRGIAMKIIRHRSGGFVPADIQEDMRRYVRSTPIRGQLRPNTSDADVPQQLAAISDHNRRVSRTGAGPPIHQIFSTGGGSP